MSEADRQALRDQLVKMIYEYRLHVLGFVKAYRAKFGVQDLLGSWLSGKVAQHGSLDDKYETRFSFHGVGCHLESDRGEVEFNFGPDGRHDGFDGWLLWIFAQSRARDYPQFQRLEIVESVLGELVTDGVVFRPRWLPSPKLCYLKE